MEPKSPIVKGTWNLVKRSAYLSDLKQTNTEAQNDHENWNPEDSSKVVPPFKPVPIPFLEIPLGIVKHEQKREYH